MKIRQQQESMTLKDLLMYKDYMLIIASSGVLNYISVTIELNSMIISLYDFHWSMEKLSVVVLVSTSTYLVMFTLLGRNMFKDISVIYLYYVLGFIIYWILLLILLLPTFIPELFKTKTPQYVLIGVALFLKMGIGFSLFTTAKLLTFYLVPDHSASFADGFRNGVVKIFPMMGFIFSGYMFSQYVYIYVFPIFCCALFLFTVILLSRRKIYL